MGVGLVKSYMCDKILPRVTGDIDPEFNVVEVTEEAKQELAKIENKIGDYICRLCKEVCTLIF